jgi:UDP-2,3-diacylglucosamine hydrolase
MLNRSNSRRFAADAHRHEAVFRQFVAGMAGRPIDLVVLGHLHKVIDAEKSTPRFVVLGGWFQQSSYLRIDPSGASLIVEPDPPHSSVEPSGPSRHAEIRPSPAHRPPFA